jgi:hypothetical protein
MHLEFYSFVILSAQISPMKSPDLTAPLRAMVLLPLFGILPVPLTAQHFREDMHAKLLSGEHVWFNHAGPAENRALKAEWIREAADNGVPISNLPHDTHT